MSVVSVLVNKIDSERKYVLADPEIPFSIMSNFSGKKLEYVCNISGTSVEKIAEKLNLKPKTIEIDQKGIPKYLAGYMTLE
jgi:DNA-binding NarL/FixJ family response regulator